jgi:hypothetical protein
MFCTHCQRHAVEITRSDDWAGVRCHGCDRKWRYPNSRLSDETLLRSYAAQVTSREEHREA